MATSPQSWIGREISFEGPEGEGSVAYVGIVTKEDGNKIFVSGHSDIEEWMDKSDVGEPE